MKRFPLFRPAAKGLFEFKLLLGELSECQLSEGGGANFVSAVIFEAPPPPLSPTQPFASFVPDKVFVALEQGADIKKSQLESKAPPVPRKPDVLARTHNFISIHQASRGCDELHLNGGSVAGLFAFCWQLSATSPRDGTKRQQEESQKKKKTQHKDYI